MAATTHRLLSAINRVATLLLCVIIYKYSAQETHYIKPTPNAPCPADSCFTLSEYAHQPREYLTHPITILVFMPGDHTLDESILVSDTASFTMRGRFNSTVTSSRPVGFYFQNVSHVIIHTLTFTSSSRRLSQNNEYHYIFSNAVQASLVQHLEINNCTFQDNYRTAVRVHSSIVVLEGTNTFKNNCLLGIEPCLGAGIRAVKSSLSLNGNNTFASNSAMGGGGLYVKRSTITASGENSFVDNSAISHRGGGGIFAYKSALRFFGTTNFKHNSARVSNGGGIHMLESALYISGIAVFEGNSAHGKGIRSLYLDSGCGGGMFATRSSITFAGRSTFLKDSAESCGGLLVYNSTMKVNGSIQFHNNSVAYHGGGGCVVYSNVSVIGNSTFTGNRARRNGGCVYIRGSNVSFSVNNSLHSSVALGKGAAIILHESNLNFSGNCSFADNGVVTFSFTRERLREGKTTKAGRREGGGCWREYLSEHRASM